MSRIYRQASFLTGARVPRQFPPDRGHEVAFAGRSNAGKSSALNALAGIGRLARTSKTPGRTRELNFFALDPDRRLVDLPGYGYARAPEGLRETWVRTVNRYLEGRQCLRGLVLVADIRRPFTEHDERLVGWCASSGTPLHMLLTKADKISRGPAKAALLEARRRLAEQGGTAQTFSALKRTGIDELAQRLDGWLRLIEA